MKMFLASFLIWNIYVYSQNIYWNKDFTLSWDNFSKVEKAANLEAAKAFLGIKLMKTKSEVWGNKSEFTAVAFISVDSSYYLPEKINELTLQHEQTHFDITELYARRLRQIYTKKKFIFDFEARMLFNLIFVEHNKTQIEYEVATSFGNNQKMQDYWTNKIKSQLEDLTAYEYKIDDEIKDIFIEYIKNLTSLVLTK